MILIMLPQNNNTTIENFWTALVWLVVFVLILVWDQEKIVVVNLVLFCYFIYYTASNSIQSTLQSRTEMLRNALSSEMTTRRDDLHDTINNSNLAASTLTSAVTEVLSKASSQTKTLLNSSLNFLKGGEENAQNQQLASILTLSKNTLQALIFSQYVVITSTVFAWETSSELHTDILKNLEE